MILNKIKSNKASLNVQHINVQPTQCKTIYDRHDTVVHTVNVRKPNVRNPNNAENRTNACSEHFVRFSVVRDIMFMFERSDFGQTAKLGRFIYKGGHKNYIFIYKTV